MAYKSTQLKFQSWRGASSGHLKHFVLDLEQQAKVARNPADENLSHKIESLVAY